MQRRYSRDDVTGPRRFGRRQALAGAAAFALATVGVVVEIVKRRFETTFSVMHEAPFTEFLSLDVAEVDEPKDLARFEFSQVGIRRFGLEYFLWYEDALFLYADSA